MTVWTITRKWSKLTPRLSAVVTLLSLSYTKRFKTHSKMFDFLNLKLHYNITCQNVLQISSIICVRTKCIGGDLVMYICFISSRLPWLISIEKCIVVMHFWHDFVFVKRGCMSPQHEKKRALRCVLSWLNVLLLLTQTVWLHEQISEERVKKWQDGMVNKTLRRV